MKIWVVGQHFGREEGEGEAGGKGRREEELEKAEERGNAKDWAGEEQEEDEEEGQMLKRQAEEDPKVEAAIAI